MTSTPQNTDQFGNAVRPTLSLNAQERRDFTQLIDTLYEHYKAGASQISFGALLGDDDVWTVGQEIQRWFARLH